MDNSPKKGLYFIAAGVLLILVVYVGWNYYGRVVPEDYEDYVVAGIPYIGLSSPKNISNFSHYGGVLSMVFRYWGDERLEPWEIGEVFPPAQAGLQSRSVFLQELRDFARQQGYNSESYVAVDGINDLKRYVNPDQRTPVIVRIDAAPDVPAYSWAVVFGILESQKKVIMHDFYLGNNLAVSFEDFMKRWANPVPPIAKPFSYLVIQPVDLKGAIAKLPQSPVPYLPTESIFIEIREAEEQYLLGISLANQKGYDAAINILTTLASRPEFPRLPIHQQVMTYTYLAYSYYFKDEYDNAHSAILLALSRNRDLKMPHSPWPPEKLPSASSDRVSAPLFMYAEIRLARGDKKGAIATYEEILKEFQSPNVVQYTSKRLEQLRSK